MSRFTITPSGLIVPAAPPVPPQPVDPWPAYRASHACCPRCGSDRMGERTCMYWSRPPDMNRITCAACQWKGKVDELRPRGHAPTTAEPSRLRWQPDWGGWYAGSPQSDPPGEAGCPDWAYSIQQVLDGSYTVWLMKASMYATERNGLGEQSTASFSTLAEAQAWCEAREAELTPTEM